MARRPALPQDAKDVLSRYLERLKLEADRATQDLRIGAAWTSTQGLTHADIGAALRISKAQAGVWVAEGERAERGRCSCQGLDRPDVRGEGG